jgi:hypothetical protein
MKDISQICYGYPGLKYPDVFRKYPSSGALTIIQNDSQVNQSLGTSKPKVKVVGQKTGNHKNKLGARTQWICIPK